MKIVKNVLLFLFFIVLSGAFSNAWSKELLIRGKGPMVLSCDMETGLAEFKVRCHSLLTDRKLARLRREVEKLFKSKALKFGEYTVELEGYPTWGPYHSFGSNENELHLIFGEKVTVDDDDKYIIVRGTKEKQSYFPYNLEGY